jgi:hypothetical protein
MRFSRASSIGSFRGHHKLEPNQLSGLIASVQQAIGQSGKPPEPEEIRALPSQSGDPYIEIISCALNAVTGQR